MPINKTYPKLIYVQIDKKQLFNDDKAFETCRRLIRHP
jgi:hypothetical protein